MGEPPDEADVLPDPYQEAPRPPPPPPRARLSRLALSSLLSALFLGPVGAVLAIVLGWYARRDLEKSAEKRRGWGLATLGLALGVILTPAWGAAMSYFAWTHRYREPPEAEQTVPAASSEPREPSPSPPGHAPPPAAAPPAAAPLSTTIDHVGKITVVDLGRSTPSLSDELAKQRAEAARDHETLLLMTTAADCDPCRGVDRSLKDRMMQTALAGVRLVRVDTNLFGEDLQALRVPHDRIPGFYLLAPDLAPRDGIDGGEWDADITPNIAPVLGAFVRGKYKERREQWHPLPGTGVAL